MHSDKKTAVTVIVLIQLIIISFLCLLVWQKTKISTQTKSYTTISKKDLVYNPDSDLKHYWEPKANSIVHPNFPSVIPEGWPEYSINATYTVNSDGLYERYNYPVEKPKNTFRIITLGDSFTQGAYTDTKDSYPEQLEDYLNKSVSCNAKKFEVINLGVFGYDIQYSVERYKLKGQKYNPDLIIWLLKDDDFIQINEITTSLEKKYYLEFGPEKVEELAKQGKFITADASLKEFNDNYSRQSVIDYQKKQLERLMDMTKANVLVLTLGVKEYQYDILKELRRKYGDRFWYTDDFNLYKDKSWYLPDYHPTKIGSKKIANFALENMTAFKLLPCK